MFYTYVLLSQKDRKRYIGQTSNLDRRIVEHNSGMVPATKNRRPLKIKYFEVSETREEAVEKEKFFKTHKGYNYLKGKGVYDP